MKSDWNKFKILMLWHNINITSVDISLPNNKDITEFYDVHSVPHIIKVESNGSVISIYKGNRKYHDIYGWAVKN